MGFIAAGLEDEICRRGSIKDGDVARLRKAVYQGTSIALEDADALIRLNRACKIQDPAWASLYIEAITDHVLCDAAPTGYLTLENFAWLKAAIAPKSQVEHKNELELLITLIGKSRWSPEALSVLALSQVQLAIQTGSGPLRPARGDVTCQVLESDCEVLRRILYAFGGDGALAISVREADVLVAISEATKDRPLNPAFSDLYAKTLTSVILTNAGFKAPTREVALGREGWLDTHADGTPEHLLAHMAALGPSPILSSYREQPIEARGLQRLERQRTEIITGEASLEATPAWISQRLAPTPAQTFNDKFALAFLKRETRALQPHVQALLGRMGQAAA